MPVLLVDCHELSSSVLSVLIQRRKLDLVRVLAHVPERALDRIQVVRADGDKLALATQVLVQLVLEVDERLVLELVQRAGQSQHCTSEHWAQRGCRRLDVHLLELRGCRQGIRRCLLLVQEDTESTREAFNAQKIVAVSRDLNLQLRWRRWQALLPRCLDLFGGLRSDGASSLPTSSSSSMPKSKHSWSNSSLAGVREIHTALTVLALEAAVELCFVDADSRLRVSGSSSCRGLTILLWVRLEGGLVVWRVKCVQHLDFRPSRESRAYGGK